MSEVNLDDLDDNKVSLLLKPYESDVEIAIVKYGNDWKFKKVKGLDYCTLTCNYNKNEDQLEIAILNGFDVFIFNICSLLDIGHIAIDEDVEPSGLFQAMEGFFLIEVRVKSITLSLEEFKLLDGFIGEFSICNPSIDFIKLIISLKSIHESVCDGAHVPDVKSNNLKRSENLFIWD